MVANENWTRADVPPSSYPVTVHVPADLFNSLIRTAQKSGLTASEFAKRATVLMLEQVEAGAPPPPKARTLHNRAPMFKPLELVDIFDMASSGSSALAIATTYGVEPDVIRTILKLRLRR